MAEDKSTGTLILWRLAHDECQLSSLLGRYGDVPSIKETVLRSYIPVGATAWRRTEDAEWHSLAELPPEWKLAPKPPREQKTYKSRYVSKPVVVEEPVEEEYWGD